MGCSTSCGVKLKTERDRRLFPVTDRKMILPVQLMEDAGGARLGDEV